MKRGIIVTNAYYTAQNITRQSGRLKGELETLGISVQLVQSDAHFAYIKDGKTAVDLPPCDFVLYLDKDKHIANMLEDAGLRLFNSAKAIAVCDDKMLTYIALSNSGIAMPDTFSAPLCYIDGADTEHIKIIEKKLGFPMVVKENFGSMGKQVYLARSSIELKDLAQKLQTRPHLYQRYIGAKRGEDIRITVIGGKAVAAIKRYSNTDFRSNADGALACALDNTDNRFLAAAEEAAKILGLDYCGVDLLEDEQGAPVLCEVNSNAFFNKSEEVTGINIAKLYAEHIYNTICNKI